MADFIDASTGEILSNTEDNIVIAFAVYQQTAAKHGWRTNRYINDPFRKGIKARMEEAGGMAAWREALEIASKSDYLMGRVIGAKGTRFRMSLNFLLQPTSFEKILSGFYTRDDGPTTSKLALPTLQTPAQKPAEPFKHDIESPEERMAFTIARYRARGKYADGNRVEEALSKLQKRPPVLVLDPTLAWTSAASKPAPAAPRAPAQTVTDIPWTDEDVPMSAYHEVEA